MQTIYNKFSNLLNTVLNLQILKINKKLNLEIEILLNILNATIHKLPYNITSYTDQLNKINTKLHCSYINKFDKNKKCLRIANYKNSKNEIFCWIHAQQLLIR